MFVVFFIAFKCMLTSKQVWARGIKNGVLDENLDGFSRGKPRTGLPVLVQLAKQAHG